MEWSTASAKPTQSHQASPTTLAKSAQLAPPVRTNTAAKDSQQPTSRTVKVSQLSRYVGKLIQLDTNKGKRRVGRLESIDDERVRLLMKMTGGEFSFPIKIEEISSARVLR
jgi:predicted transcriptional regulator